MRKHKQIYQAYCWITRNPNSKKRIVLNPLWKDGKTMVGLSQSDNSFKYLAPEYSCVAIIPFNVKYTSKSLSGYPPTQFLQFSSFFYLPSIQLFLLIILGQGSD